MKLPAVTDFADGAAFMAVINAWQAASAAAYAQLRAMFEATPPFVVKPDRIGQVAQIAHVDMSRAPGADSIEPALRNLASHALQRGCKIVRVCHGSFEERGEAVWSCFVELQKA